MTNSYQGALKKLLSIQASLDAENLATLPRNQVANLEKSKAGVYSEIQALQAGQMGNLDSDYEVVTTEFSDCKSDFKSLADWVAEKQKTDKFVLSMLSKGVSLALSLLV
ncbi:MAG: hypothetical protein COB93_11385 [Sneathiella sp.]|nr:MAG: hypothetical protein COB93_11385 [Sneathiella sp.]